MSLPEVGGAPLKRRSVRLEPSRRGRRLLTFWRSPPDQPGWARPAVLVVAGVAALAYAWGANGAELEPFYGAAARSMSESWHDFIFGAFDPLGTVTVDKLPGALWLQALSLRIFGLHVWAFVLPQIIEGVASVLVLYRAVRRLAGPVAGIAAAGALALTPITVELNRGNVSDSLLILLTVLAADATAAAIVSGRWRRLLIAGVWIGLAFQAKMLQAWLIMPVVAFAYLLSAHCSLKLRARHVALTGLLAVVVSLSWMSAVSLVPASQRPYVDGSRNDSLFSQVFVYNGFARLGKSEMRSTLGAPSPFQVAFTRETEKLTVAFEVKPGWSRLIARPLGRTWGWLLPAACLAALLLVWERRRFGQRDPRLVCLAFWGSWLLILGASFSVGVYVNAYYLAALSPAVAAILGLGVDLYWRHRAEAHAGIILAVALAATAGYGAFLISGGVAVPGWLLPACLTATAIGVAAAIAAASGGRSRPALGLLALTSLLAFPAVTSALVVARGHGPFDIPYDVPSTQGLATPVFRTRPRLRSRPRSGPVSASSGQSSGQSPLVAVYTSAIASEVILYTGSEVLPLGGFTGRFPTPTIPQLRQYIATGRLRFVTVPVKPATNSPLVRWVRTHCKRRFSGTPRAGIELALFNCRTAT